MKVCLAQIVIGLVLLPGAGFAATLDDYNAGSLSPTGSLTSWAPVVGSDVATTSNFAGLSAPSVSNTDPVFNGHNYVSFGVNAGLATTGSIISGSADRTITAVYAATSAPSATAGVAGVANSGAVGTWFDIQDRDNFAVGDPYLAGFGADASSGQNSAAERLTFALATYDGTNETLYWAYGTSGAVSSVTVNVGALATSGQFELGFDDIEPSPGQLELGDAAVFNNYMTATQAAAEIASLQFEFVMETPEPSTWALMLGGLGSLAFVHRVRCRAS